MSDYQWRKSSYSGDASNCVCLAAAPDGTVRLRDSKAPATLVATTPQALRRFLDAMVAGSFEGAGPA
ncbi:DUF397 domain-containing protein [Streptomyces finlayi]|uniref:DUF397 domain-containing protein n=1 Tax=Streptomyces finlayi TaxID=67296 RepID=A0A7G7BQ10_9ACTN|nr:DUF397 domain-containing protein [Streptomyces finlayi]QNE77425.1 DUF397 domain-containing protein [Streptomyces finlayi]